MGDDYGAVLLSVIGVFADSQSWKARGDTFPVPLICSSWSVGILITQASLSAGRGKRNKDLKALSRARYGFPSVLHIGVCFLPSFESSSSRSLSSSLSVCLCPCPCLARSVAVSHFLSLSLSLSPSLARSLPLFCVCYSFLSFSDSLCFSLCFFRSTFCNSFWCARASECSFWIISRCVRLICFTPLSPWWIRAVSVFATLFWDFFCRTLPRILVLYGEPQ